MTKVIKLLLLLLFVFSLTLFAASKPSISYSDLVYQAEADLSLVTEAKRTAERLQLPHTIYTVNGKFVQALGVENGEPVYGVASSLTNYLEGEVYFYDEIVSDFNLDGARKHYANRTENPTLGFPEPLPTESTEYILIPESSNDAVMAFDPETGALVDTTFVNPSLELATPIKAMYTPWGSVVVSDQVKDGLVEFDMDGNFVKFFAPTGGAVDTILNNVRGWSFHPATGNILVTSASSPAEHRIQEFDTDGNYLGSFITNGLGGLNGPWEVLFRESDVLIPANGSNAVHRYDHDGNYLDNFIPAITFPEQIAKFADGKIGVAGFSAPSGLYIFDANGTQLSYFDAIGGMRGCYALGNGNFLVTNGSGVHILDATGVFVETVISGVSARFCGVSSVPADFISIASARVDADINFVPDLIDDTVTVKGVVNSVNFTASSDRFSYYIQDNTGGINITKGSETGGGPVFNIGDEIKVTGIVSQFAGATQLSLDADMLAGIEVLSTGNTLEPMEMTIGEYLTDPEAYEGMLIKFMNVDKDAGADPWPASGNSANIDITDGTVTTLRVDSDTDLDENSEPEWPVTHIMGVATQYSWSTPPNDGYQITPSYYSDIQQGAVPVSVNFDTEAGWNMVSVPVMKSDMTMTTLFPTAGSDAFYFDNGYGVADTLKNGTGYWIKFDAFATHSFEGEAIYNTKSVVEGWNLIGPFHEAVAVTDVITDPADIINSSFFDFSGTYVMADSLFPGRGYWVKTTEAGSISFNMPVSKNGRTSDNSVSSEWTSLTFTNASGESTTLYLSDKANTEFYSLPPVPPAGAFDVRFTSNKYVENFSGVLKAAISTVDYPVEVTVNGADIKIAGDLVVSGSSYILKSGNSLTIESVDLPSSFSLAQNYPNPFNPSTNITFSLPVNANVKISVYNSLGQKVVDLADAAFEAGNHKLSFNASNIATGIYFYTINVTGVNGKNFSDTKKMMLIK